MITLKQICCACPESYDIYENSIYIGHIRVRYGRVTFSKLIESNPFDEYVNVYSDSIEGDGLFESDEERSFHLYSIINLLGHTHYEIT